MIYIFLVLCDHNGGLSCTVILFIKFCAALGAIESTIKDKQSRLDWLVLLFPCDP